MGMAVIIDRGEQDVERTRIHDAEEALLDAVADEIDRRVAQLGADAGVDPDEDVAEQVRDQVLAEQRVASRPFDVRRDKVAQGGHRPGVFYSQVPLDQCCPLGKPCRECRRAFAEMRVALGDDVQALSDIDLARMLRAVCRVNARGTYAALDAIERGEWEPILPYLREAWQWLIAESTAISALPPSRRRLIGYRPLERWKGRIPGLHVRYER